MLALFASLLASLAYVALMEYAVHRWYMHRPASVAWREHAIEHHRDERNDDYYLCPFLRSIAFFWLIGAAGLLAIGLWWGPLVLAGVMAWWRGAWITIHRIVHGTGDRWLLATVLCPWASVVVRHHARHHECAGHNFGAVFFFTDRLFGTHKQ